MNIMEVIIQIIRCIEILMNDIKIDTTDQYMLQLIKNYKVYILVDIRALRGNSWLDMYDLFWDNYKMFVPGELTELQRV